MAGTDTDRAQPSRAARPAWLKVVLGVVGFAAVAVLLVYFWPTVTVPDLVQKPRSVVEEQLADVRLRLGAVSEVATTSVPFGVVVAQSPAAGTTVRRRSSVDITVAAESSVVVIPDVTGMDSAQAKAALESLVLEVVTIDVLDTGDVAVGTVVAQMPSPGTEWPSGEPVALAIAAGPDDGTGTEVPNVVGSSFDLAVETLAESGLLGVGITDDSANLDRSDVDVLEQVPAEGVLVRQGSTVLVRMGQ